MKREDIQEKSWEPAGWDMLYLVECGANARLPSPDRVAAMDLEKVYALSKRQSLEAIAYMALERVQKTAFPAIKEEEKAVLTRWEEDKNKAIRRTMLMDAARAKLFAYLDANKIWHMPLKGAVLCDMYPEFGMRQMSDNDILFDPSFRRQVHDWFVEQGYTVKSYEENNDDVYHKKPVYNFEMHIAFFLEKAHPELARYFAAIKNRLQPVSEKSFEYRMTDEDFYLYLLAHEYKHYSNGGTGLRSLLDVYVFLIAKNRMDWNYLSKELAELGLVDFEKEMRELAQKAFNPEMEKAALSQWELRMLTQLLFSGTYGTQETFWKNQLRKMQPDGEKISAAAKCKYLMRRLFPERTDMEIWCRRNAPWFLRHQWLMPAAFVWRIITRAGQKKKEIKAELDAVRKG